MAHEPADLLRPPPDGVEVTAVPHPFSTKHIQFLTDSHATLAELVAEAGVPPGCDARVFLERRGVLYGPIPREQWPRIRPKKGCRVTIRALPGTGGGGGDSNKTLRMILIAVIIIVAIVVTVATSGLGGGIFAAVIPLVASLAIFAVNMLLAPPPPKLGSLAALAGNPASSTAGASATYSITGSQNKANPYGVIPKIFGSMRIFPPSAAPAGRGEEGDP